MRLFQANISFINKKLELFLGWLELLFKTRNKHPYKFFMKDIEPTYTQDNTESIVCYKVVGCRTRLYKSATELNKLALFELFRSDHAQMIVSLATADALLGKSKEEMIDKYKNYIEYCNSKLDKD